MLHKGEHVYSLRVELCPLLRYSQLHYGISDALVEEFLYSIVPRVYISNERSDHLSHILSIDGSIARDWKVMEQDPLSLLQEREGV